MFRGRLSVLRGHGVLLLPTSNAIVLNFQGESCLRAAIRPCPL
eukprot:COSAG01_NODE_67309_length_267_cov_0.928571_1_plen_42_part_10